VSDWEYAVMQVEVMDIGGGYYMAVLYIDGTDKIVGVVVEPRDSL
jgi:hypothetical protein